MEIIREPLPDSDRGVIEVLLPVDRQTLSKRRWRGVADDGREFGFDLVEPLQDRVPFFCVEGATYVIAQQPEPIFEIPLTTPADSARLGWLIGNLHFSIEVGGEVIHVAHDSALRQMLVREHIPFTEVLRVFHPMRQGHVH
jgi:urease accessory protein